MDEELKKRTQATAAKLFGKGIRMDPPYLMWKEFDRGLANDFSALQHRAGCRVAESDFARFFSPFAQHSVGRHGSSVGLMVEPPRAA